jgi:hypothetical protein
MALFPTQFEMGLFPTSVCNNRIDIFAMSTALIDDSQAIRSA